MLPTPTTARPRCRSLPGLDNKLECRDQLMGPSNLATRSSLTPWTPSAPPRRVREHHAVVLLNPLASWSEKPRTPSAFELNVRQSKLTLLARDLVRNLPPEMMRGQINDVPFVPLDIDALRWQLKSRMMPKQYEEPRTPFAPNAWDTVRRQLPKLNARKLPPMAF